MNDLQEQSQVLVFVAHADDETLGCGGYIPILVDRGCRVYVVIASCCRFKRGTEEVDNRQSAFEACKVLGVQEVSFLGLEDQRFEQYGTREIIEGLDRLSLEPELILTHSGRDLNRDHRTIHEISLLYARPSVRRARVLGCEVVNSVELYGDAFRANYYVDVSRTIDIKKAAFECYGNEQRSFPHPNSIDGIETKARQRGMESGCCFAEAYQVIRWFD